MVEPPIPVGETTVGRSRLLDACARVRRVRACRPPLAEGSFVMVNHTRMSPMTAFFIGIFGVGAVGIASGTAVVLYAMNIIDTKAARALGFAETAFHTTLSGLPDLLESLPPVISDLLNDRRAPEYAAKLDIDVRFVADERSGRIRPVMTITNNGDQVVSMLAVRVAALGAERLPIREWTEVVATPIAIDDDWRGPLMPGATRYVVLSSGWRGISIEKVAEITGSVEISDVRLWRPSEDS